MGTFFLIIHLIEYNVMGIKNAEKKFNIFIVNCVCAFNN